MCASETRRQGVDATHAPRAPRARRYAAPRAPMHGKRVSAPGHAQAAVSGKGHRRRHEGRRIGEGGRGSPLRTGYVVGAAEWCNLVKRGGLHVKSRSSGSDMSTMRACLTPRERLLFPKKGRSSGEV